MLGRQLSQHTKFKFCFLELSGILKNIFDTQLGESLDSEPEDTQGQLYSQDPPPKKMMMIMMLKIKKTENINLRMAASLLLRA